MGAVTIRHPLPRIAALSAVPTIRSITGIDVCPPAPSPLPPLLPPPPPPHMSACKPRCASSSDDEKPFPLGKPRISSVTDSDSTPSSPRASVRADRSASPPLRRKHPDVGVHPPGPSTPSDDDHDGDDHNDDHHDNDDNDDDNASTYSHASVLNLDELDDDHLLGALRLRRPTLRLSRARKNNNNNIININIKPSGRRAVVLACNEFQPHNRLQPLFERALHALVDAVDADALSASAAVASFRAFSPLFTSTERTVVAQLFRNVCAQLRREAPTPWRSPLCSETTRVAYPPGVDEALLRAVMYGAHILPAAGAETILIRLAGAYHREQLRKRCSKWHRVMVPLSFAMTLTALLAALSRLECSPSFRRLRSRAATSRAAEPHAVVAVKVNYDGARLAFDVSLHGEAPCTVLFRKPRLMAARKLCDFDALVSEIGGVISEFGQHVSAGEAC